MIHESAPGIAQSVQFAVAPALLLVGIGGILNVVAVRLGRIVDRARQLERLMPDSGEAERAVELAELRVLDRRITLCHWSVGLITASALLVCLLVALLFLSNMAGAPFSRSLSALFVAAMAALSLGLLLFLGEVRVATRTVRVSDAYSERRRH